MCQAVVFAEERLYNLNDLLGAQLIGLEHVPADDELARNGVNVREVCFCAVDVEEILDDAGVAFIIDDLGDIHVAERAEAITQWDAWEALGRWWRRRRRAAWPQLA